MSKRKRTTVDAAEGDCILAEDTVPATRSTDFWFPDGSVVLQAENTQFKVYKYLLARHSVVFADLFQLPQPHDEPAIEGCPVVHLQDSTEDISHMLMILHDQCKYTVNDPLPFSVLATMVRMGVKYDIKAFRDQAVARLGSEISAGPSSSAGATDAYLSGDWIAREPGLLLKIVNLSHEYRIQRFLPMAYLICIIEGLDNVLRDEPLQSLPREALQTCLKGHKALLQSFDRVFQLVEQIGSSPSCRDKKHCRNAYRALYPLWRPEPDLEYLINSWNDFKEDFEETKNIDFGKIMCFKCLSDFETEFRARTRVFWDEHLPLCFGDSGWDDLKNFDDE